MYMIGVYLAAGMSSRMGRNKLNMPFRNGYLGGLALQAAIASRLNHTIVVTRKHGPLDWLNPFQAENGWSCLDSANAEIGQSASLISGVKAAGTMGADAVVIMLGDQPFLTTDMINRLIEEYEKSPELSHISFLHQGLPKPPVLLSRPLFSDVMKLKGDQGARALIRNNPHTGKSLEGADDTFFYDVDTMEEYLFIRGMHE